MHFEHERCAHDARVHRDVTHDAEAELVKECRVDRVASGDREQRVAVGRRADDCFGCQIRARAGPVLDHHRLPEPLGEPLRDQARGDVGGAAGGKPDEQAYRTARIRLRPSDARHGEQRSGARGQVKKISAGKFHAVPCLLCSRSRNQSAAIAKTCRSKRAYSLLICARTLSNSALAARAARSASRAATSAKVHCQATSGSLPSPPKCLTNILPAGSPIERRTAEALRRRSRTSAAKPGLAKYCVRSTIIVVLVGIIVPCPNADADGTTGSAAAPAARCKNFRRGSFMLNLPYITQSPRRRGQEALAAP